MTPSDPHPRIAVLERELAWAHLKIQSLTEALRQQRVKLLGPRSETLSDLQLQLLVVANFGVPGFSCDVNSDTHVDVLDVVALLREALNGGSAHDLSHDGITNVVDVQKAIDAVAGMGCIW